MHKKHKLKDKPKTLEETYVYLDHMFDETAKYNFMSLPEDVATGQLHYEFGMWIRNKWGLWGNSKLKHYFLNRNIRHPDDMSTIILISYHRYLNNNLLHPEGQIKRYQDYYECIAQHRDSIFNLKDYLKNNTTDSTLISYFPVADTILVSVYASYKRWFTTYASSVKATAVVREHRGDKLFIEIIAMENSANKKAERKVGDKFEEQPMFCSLIPPKGWTYKK